MAKDYGKFDENTYLFDEEIPKRAKKEHSIRFRADEETIRMIDEMKENGTYFKANLFKAFVRKQYNEMVEEKKRRSDYYRRLDDIESIRKMVINGDDPTEIKRQIGYIYKVFR